MSTGRLKDQKDFDLEQIVQLIDSALESDDQRIKDALRALMTITVLCTAEHPDQAFKGPLGRIQEDYNNLNSRLGTLEEEVRQMKWEQQKKQVEPFVSPLVPSTSPPWIHPNDPTKVKPMWDTSWNTRFDAGDDPNYTGATAGKADVSLPMLAEDFLKELESK
jgi:hypothetical protein